MNLFASLTNRIFVATAALAVMCWTSARRLSDVLNTLSQQTGLSREELLSRLTRELPAAVDKFTPEGRLPTEDEAARLI